MYSGGKLAKKGMIAGAGYIGAGIKKGGSYIVSKISKNKEETQISESTMAKIKLAKVTTNGVFEFASGAVRFFNFLNDHGLGQRTRDDGWKDRK